MKKPHILVVEDDRAIGEVMQYLLEEEGFTTHLESNGNRVKGHLDNHKPVLAILDVFLPGIHGDAIVNWMRSEAKYDNIKIILMSASNEAKQLARTTKADAFLDKPFNNDELVKLIHKLLGD